MHRSTRARHTPALSLPAPFFAALVLSASSVRAIAPDPPDRDAPSGASRRAIEPAPIEPSEPEVSTAHPAGLTAGKDWQRTLSDVIGSDTPPSTLREGTFIVDRPGRLVDAPNDRLIFVPDRDARLAGEGPMLLLPCATLGRLERRLIGARRVVLSGEVFVAHNRANLLIVDFALRTPSGTPSDPGGAPSGGGSGAGTGQTEGTDADEPAPREPATEDDPEVEQLLRELGETEPEARRRRIETLEDPRGDGAEGQTLTTAPPTLAHGVREGTILIRRMARLDRGADGSWRVVFDNDDPDGADALGFTLLPCRMSESMERIAIDRGPETRVLVSGRVYVHDRRGYLLPTFVQYQRDGEIEPWQ